MQSLFKYLSFFIVITFFSCTERVDLIVHHAVVYTADNQMNIEDALAVKDGKFVAVGSNDEILKNYRAANMVDAQGLAVFPGLIDAHCHFLGLGLNLNQAQLAGTQSFAEVLTRVKDYAAMNEAPVIRGRGWDQNDWTQKDFPTKDSLDLLFPDRPVVLERIDGHAYLVNQKALDLAGIDQNTQIPGGTVVLKNGKPTGVLVDTPMSLVDAVLPAPSPAEKAKALKEAQKIAFKYGLTTVDDAGLDKEDILLIDSLQQRGELDIRVYAMIANRPENLDYFLTKAPYKTDRLNVRSVKVYADGALGSRGAALLEPYSDAPEHKGTLITDLEALKTLAARISKTPYQMNTHAIGDAANAAVIEAYRDYVRLLRDPRWRIEHAQVIDSADFDKFSKKIIPSIQPLHATSDMYWAEDRLGSARVKNAYAFKDLLDWAGLVALGTDFPVETVNPFHTFYAAIARKDLNGNPEGGYQTENKLSRGDALLGMTRWAAYANFEDKEKGSIEPGKVADFVILDRDIMEVPHRMIPGTRVVATLIDGKIVYSNRD
ncbi:MAG: amidohydrolase [Flavobacteriaceae bacterium]